MRSIVLHHLVGPESGPDSKDVDSVQVLTMVGVMTAAITAAVTAACAVWTGLLPEHLTPPPLADVEAVNDVLIPRRAAGRDPAMC